MEPISTRLQYLLDRYTKGLGSEEEIKELFALLKEEDPGGMLERKIRELWNSDQHTDSLSATDWDNIYQSIVSTPVVRRKRFAWRRAIIAVACLVIVVSATFLWVQRTRGKENSIARNERTTPVNDALPGQSKARLTLANGEVILLDSAGPGKLTTQGNMDVMNEGNGIAYSGEQQSSEVMYNTLTTQRGEQYPLTLADGTKIWLNAASSIRFPVAFTGKKRVVEMTGEAYFEVAHNPDQPFIVKKPGSDLSVQVLGTHFNVNAYDDESMVKVSLLEGSVKVNKGLSSGMLKPGQQAQVKNSGVKVVSDIDLEGVLSWKNGYFSFKHTDLPTMLRQLSRWYDVDVVFETSVPDMQIGGGITRNTNLSQVLKILKELNVKFEIKGKQLIVRK